jgi:hypothetical protein
MTFLELCQMVVRQSGTIHGVKPLTVTGQTDRLGLIVEFVHEAYVDIQNAHRMWRWMQSTFTGQTIAGDQRYRGTDFTDEMTGTPVLRWSQWGFKGDGSDLGLSMYLTSAGVNEEGTLRFLDYGSFYETQLRGPATPGKPQFFSVTTDDQLIISPVPDAVYTLRGKYRKSPQLLTVDADVPEMPVDFHTVIKDAALCYIEGFDEGPRIPLYRLRMLPNWSMLEHAQLPKMTWGAPLA